MVIADRYERRLAMDHCSLAPALLLQRAGALDIVRLDGEGQDVLPAGRLLLARFRSHVGRLAGRDAGDVSRNERCHVLGRARYPGLPTNTL